MRELGHERPGQLAALLERVPERGVRPPRDAQRRLAHQRGAGRHHLQAAAVRAVARGTAGRPCRSTMCPSSAPAPIQPRCSRAAEHEPAADPGAEREHHDVAEPPPPRRSRASASTAQLPSLSTVTGSPRRSRHDRAERHVRERQVRRVDRRARAPVERHGDAEADRRDLLVDRGAGLARPRSTIVAISCAWSSPNAWRRTRWRTARSGPTTPARSFVPPRSTPMTQLVRAGPPAWGLPPYPPPMADEKPEYKVYRSRPRLPAPRAERRRRRARSWPAAASARGAARTTRSSAPAAAAAAAGRRRRRRRRAPGRAGEITRRPRRQVAADRAGRLARALRRALHGLRPDPARRPRRRRRPAARPAAATR